jgi:hypothetical protein
MLFRRKGAAEPRLEANEHRPKTPPAVSARAWRTPNTLYTCPWWTTPARHPLESHPRQPRQPHVRKLCEKYGLVDFQTVFATQSSRRQIHADKVQPALSPGTWIPTCARAKRTLPHRVARLVHDFQTMRSVRRQAGQIRMKDEFPAWPGRCFRRLQCSGARSEKPPPPPARAAGRRGA